MSDAVELTIAGARVRLLAERALYWHDAATLIAADLHWGKAAALRAVGLAIPPGTTSDDVARLTRLLTATEARRLVILGDLFHARDGKAPETLRRLAAWRAEHAEVEIVLVRGNHDYHAGDPPSELGIHCVDAPWRDGPFEFLHYPAESESGHYTLAGHLHPVAALTGPGRQRLTLPCFAIGRSAAILPAFGSFTGGAVIEPDGDRVFVIADEQVMEVTGRPSGPRTAAS